MKIKLLKDIPVQAKHNLTKGRIIEAIKAENPGWNEVHWYVVSDTEDLVCLFKDEAKEVGGSFTEKSDTLTDVLFTLMAVGIVLEAIFIVCQVTGIL